MDCMDDPEDIESRLYSMLHYADDIDNNDVSVEYVPIVPVNNFQSSKYKRVNNTSKSSKYQTPQHDVIVEPQNIIKTNSRDSDIIITDVVEQPNLHPERKRKYSETSPKNSEKISKYDILPKSKNNEKDLSRKRINPLSQLKNKKRNRKTKKQEVIDLDSSDDDESVIEVELPQPTAICINDSDDELEADKSTENIVTDINKPACVSPVPSNMSDDFIRADCSNLNISADSNNVYHFNFGLHDADLGEVQNKSKDKTTTKQKQIDDEKFATPRLKSKNKKLHPSTKNYTVTEESYMFPSVDVYESESSDLPDSVFEVPIDVDDPSDPPAKEINSDFLVMANVVHDNVNNGDILDVVEENPVNISDFHVLDETGYNDVNAVQKKSTKRVLNLKKQCLEEMNAYYNKQCKEDRYFDHVRLKKLMPNDKSYWKILPEDLYRKPERKAIVCHFCNKKGHRDDNCSKKPLYCIFCGITGHKQSRCPNQLCLNCGKASKNTSNFCVYCKKFKGNTCETCRTYGHVEKQCPDQWRRYHSTIKNEVPLNEIKPNIKPCHQLFCCGCAKRGHAVNDCKEKYKYSAYNPSVPYVCNYSPIHTPEGVKSSITLDKKMSTSKNLTKSPDATNKYATKSVPESSKKVSREPSAESTSSTYSPLQKKARMDVDENVIGQKTSYHTLDDIYIDKLKTPAGKEFMVKISKSLSVQFNTEMLNFGILQTTGKINNRELFFSEVIKFIGSVVEQVEPNNDDVLPTDRIQLIERLKHDLDLLKNDYGNPEIIFNRMKNIKNTLVKSFPDQNINKPMTEDAKKRITALKKLQKELNIILIGQKGLEGGVERILKLNEDLECLMKLQVKTVPNSVLDIITSNYIPVFSSSSCYNYTKLLKKAFPKKLNQKEDEKRTMLLKSVNTCIELMRDLIKNPIANSLTSKFCKRTKSYLIKKEQNMHSKSNMGLQSMDRRFRKKYERMLGTSAQRS